MDKEKKAQVVFIVTIYLQNISQSDDICKLNYIF